MTTIYQLTPSLYINVTQYGADPSGVNDSTTAIQNAINAAGGVAGSAVFFPAGVYIVSSTITYPGNISLIGSGDADGGTIIRAKAGANLTTPVLASADWYNNATTSGNPVEIRDIQVDGNKANSGTSGASAHGIVMMNFWSIIERCTIWNATGDGLQFTAHARNGTHITNTCVEPKISRIQARSCGGNGIHVYDNGSPLNSCTDGFLEDCIVANAGAAGIQNDMGPGWFISGNHIYGTVSDAIAISKAYATRVIGNYVDGYGSGSSAYIGGISMSCINGRGSSIIGNHIGFEGGTAAGPYQAINVSGVGSGTSICTIVNNTVIGSNQSGSIGYAIQTNSTQRSYPFIVYFHDNDAQAVATYSYIDNYVTGGGLMTIGHLTSKGAALTAAAGANAGTSPPAPVLTNATDLDGKITFGTGTSPAAGAMVIATFFKTFANAPAVTLTPINSASAALNLYVSTTTSGFTVSCVTAPSASQANTVYGFNYHVMG